MDLPRELRVELDEVTWKRSLNRFWYRAFVRRALLYYALVLVVLVLFTWSSSEPIALAVLWTVFGIGTLIHVVTYVKFMRLSIEARRTWGDDLVIFRFTPAGVSMTTSAVAAEFAWKAFKEIWRYPDMWLLFCGKHRFLTLPTHHLDDELAAYIERQVALGAEGHHCLHCGYDVRGQQEPRCPECGREFQDGRLEVARGDFTRPQAIPAAPDPAMRVYLAGPMSGYSEHNFPAFNKAAHLLREAGHSVFNPAENANGQTGEPRSFYMRLDIPALMECACVVLLPGWQQSRGANLEVWLALDLNLPVYECRIQDDDLSFFALPRDPAFALPFRSWTPA